MKTLLLILCLFIGLQFTVAAEPSKEHPTPKVIVIGAHNPTVLLNYSSDFTFLSAINAAGGINSFSRERITLIRNGKPERIDARQIRQGKKKDIPLLPWDIIFIET